MASYHAIISTLLLAAASLTSAFQIQQSGIARVPKKLLAASEQNNGNAENQMSVSVVDEYRNAPTAFLSNFMKKEDQSSPTKVDPLADIDFNAPKLSPKLPLETLAAVLDYELTNKEWFVTGNVNPIYFDDSFTFQDPDVKVNGIEDYARGVKKLFNQETSRAEIISSVVNTDVPNTITITWRLSGGVNIGPGLSIKPYICYTDFTIDEENGLIVFQEDRFDIPGWDILLSSLFPFLIGKVTKDPAPEVEPRVVEMPKLSGKVGGSGGFSLPSFGGGNDGGEGLSMADVKKYGVAGTVSYVLTELAFWAVAFPVASTALYQSTGHWPDVINDNGDRGAVLAFIFGAANIARLLVPLRLGAALALAPWVDENIINREGSSDMDE